jgi:signal transduction histidine kinase/CheY-like chemotaxis protein
MSDPTTLALQVLFGLLFLWSVWVAVRHRDVLARDVALVFAPFAVVLASGFVHQAVGSLPTWFTLATTILLLAQPVFSLKLASDIREVPTWLVPLAVVAVAIESVLIVLTASAPSVLLSAIGVFVIMELVASGYLAVEARRRSGAARVRLAVAAVATAAVAIVLLASGLAGSGAAAGVGVAIRVVSLLAAVGYWIAFLPPRPLRQFWQGTAAFGHSERLLAAPPTTRSAELWAELATAVLQLTGATAIIVLADGDALTVAASSDDAVETGTTYPDATLSGLIEGSPQDPIRIDLVNRTDSKSVKVIPLAPEQTLVGAIVLLRPRPSLFDGDDAALVAALGIRSTHLVQRREVLAEQEALSRRLADTVAALEAASAAKSDFLASMSHELRTPLNAIIGFSSLMIAQSEVDGTLTVPREWVEHIRTGGDHLLALINDVLDLAKVEAGRLELVTEPVDVGQAIGASVAGLRPLADRKGQRVETAIEPSIVFTADPGRLRQILYNLLSNAIKYTPTGGSIRVSGWRLGTEVRISVQDSGVGIAADDRVRVFEEFRQVGDAAQRHSGTGLGLALTRRLVEAHGGRIELESDLGVGSTFTVILPDRPAKMVAVERAQAAAPGPQMSADRDVLIIEDEASSARLLQTYLEDAGYRVRLASNGETGLAQARAVRPAAIVLDVLLPGIDGWEVLRRLKSEPDLRDVPVIMATVVDERGVGLALGAVDYLVKPIDPQMLLDRLGRYTYTTKVKTRAISVLAIDDDPAALDVIEGTLVPLGFSVRRASSGGEGIRLARGHRPDLVICDLIMPDVDGFQVVGELHDAADTSSIPILILTAHDLSAADRARLNGRVLGIAAKGASGADGLTDWLVRVLPPAAQPEIKRAS